MPRKSAALKKELTQTTAQQRANTPKSARRKLAPVSIRKETDAAPHAEASGVAEAVEKKGEQVIQVAEPKLIETRTSVNPDHAAELAFMREKVKVHIHETSEEQADQTFMVSVNGRRQIFNRGSEYTVPRYIVEGLARAKPVGYRNEEYFKPDGERAVRHPSRRGLRYPFSVLEDSQKGRSWLKQVLAQP